MVYDVIALERIEFAVHSTAEAATKVVSVMPHCGRYLGAQQEN